MIRLVVFDMAGTTVRDEGQVPQAFTAALAEHGVEVGETAIRALRGASKRQAIFELLPASPDRQARTERVFEAFKAQLARLYAKGVAEVPGARRVFDWLRGRGAKVALNTGFDRDTTQLLVGALGWNQGVVDAVVCGDEVAHGRPAPDLIFRCMETTGIREASRVAVVGDTVLDLQAGRNAGAGLVVGVLSGAHGRTELEAQAHAHLIGSVADLPSLLAASPER